MSGMFDETWPATSSRVVRGPGGRIVEVGVAWWPGPEPGQEGLLFRQVAECHDHGLVFRYQQGSHSFAFGANDGFAGGCTAVPGAEVTRRIRWVLEALELVGPLFPLWDGEPRSWDPLVVAVDRDGFDPQLLGLIDEAADLLLERRRGNVTQETSDRIQKVLETVEELVGARYVGAYDTGFPTVEVSLAVPGRWGSGGEWVELVRVRVGNRQDMVGYLLEEDSWLLKATWAQMWFPWPNRSFTFVRRDVLDRWLSAPEHRKPGHLNLGSEEASLFQALGEPLPFAWPSEALVRWALERG